MLLYEIWTCLTFCDRNSNWFTLSGNRQLSFAFTICPAVEKTLSAGTDIAGIQKYFLAIF